MQAAQIVDAHLITDIIAVGSMIATVAVSFTKLSTVTQTLSNIVKDHEERIRNIEWDGIDRRREDRREEK